MNWGCASYVRDTCACYTQQPSWDCPTLAAVRKHARWDGIENDVKVFLSSCFHCLAVRNGQLIRRPLGTAMHASKPNELLHFDFCYIGPGEQGYTYVLILKDDYNGYVRLVVG
jgi:hypothetical protein